MTRLAASCLVALLALASSATGDEAAELDEAVARFRAADYADAARRLGELHARLPRDLDVALLLGITLYRLGRAAEARPLLSAAAGSSDPESAASARIFLGLVADADGEVDVALANLSAATQLGAGELTESARALLRARAPRIVNLIFLIRPEFDSNVPLLPLSPTASSPAGQKADGDLLALASLSLRPLRKVGLVFEETASYRQQFTLLDYSMFDNTVGARYEYLGASDRARAGYSFELLTLGSQLLTLGHVVDAEYRRRIYSELWAGIRYSFRYRDYYPADYQPFTGPTHAGAIELGWGAPERRWELAAAYLVARESNDPVFSSTGQGARLRGRVALGRRVDLSLAAWVLARGFDAAAPMIPGEPREPIRQDTQLYGDAWVAVDLTSHLGLIAGGSLLRNLSNVKDYDSWKATLHVGLTVGYAGP